MKLSTHGMTAEPLSLRKISQHLNDVQARSSVRIDGLKPLNNHGHIKSLQYYSVFPPAFLLSIVSQFLSYLLLFFQSQFPFSLNLSPFQTQLGGLGTLRVPPAILVYLAANLTPLTTLCAMVLQ